MMMMQEHMLEKLDELLAGYLLSPEEMDYHLYELNAFFEDECGLFIYLLNLAENNGKLTAEVCVPDGEDPDEYVAGVDEYLEGRISLEPYVPKTLSLKLYADASEAQAKLRELGEAFTASLAAAVTTAVTTSYAKSFASKSKTIGFKYPVVIDDLEPGPGAHAIWHGDIYLSKSFGKDARVVHPPRPKPTVKPPPPHVALYQQRGSKGKRKRW